MARLVGAVFLLLLWSSCAPADTSGPIVLGGFVRSQAEGNMEGVLVGAKRVGGTITLTVVSDRKGHFVFPPGRLSLGRYQLSVRAIAYDMANPEQVVDPSKGPTAVNIMLLETKDLASQLTSAGWSMSQAVVG
jgi:hypothetical protein